MPSTEHSSLVRGRDAFQERSWSRAFSELVEADAEQPLGPDDLERMGEAARWSRHFGEMLDAFERAAAAYQSAGDARSAARIAAKLAIEHYERNRYALAAGWLGRARRLVEDEPPCREHGLVLMCMAQGQIEAGDFELLRSLSEEMVELGRQIGDGDVDAVGRLLLGHAHLLQGEVKQGTALIDEAMAAALGGELELWTTGQIFCSTIFACRNRGDWARAGEWSFASLRWCERQSLSGFPGLCRFHRAEVMRFRGELDRAERDATEAVEDLLDSAPRWAAFALHELGEIRRRRGDADGAAEAFTQSAELGFDPQPGLALLRLDSGRPGAAAGAIAEALEARDGYAREGRWLVLPAAVEIALAADDPDLAATALEELGQLAESLDTPAVRAAALVASGRVALAESRMKDAVRELRAGIRLWHEVEVPYETSQARELIAEAYRALGNPDAAEMELTAAHAGFERIGARREAQRLASLLPSSTRATQTALRTFMFTDIVDSTRLVEMLGDEQWESLLAWHDRALRACFDRHAGEEIKHEGDGFFVAFAEPGAALDCACAIQTSLQEHRREHGFAPSIRIGLHTTEATDRGGDYSGRGVHTTARIAASAGAGEIIASQAVLDAAAESLPTLGERSLELKGLTEPVAVAVIDWSAR